MYTDTSILYSGFFFWNCVQFVLIELMKVQKAEITYGDSLFLYTMVYQTDKSNLLGATFITGH